MKKPFFFVALLFLVACSNTDPVIESAIQEDQIKSVNLNTVDNTAFEALRTSFSERNVGYDVQYFAKAKELNASKNNRVLFVQEGSGTVTLDNDKSSKFTVGEIIMLENGRSLTTDSLISLLAFTTPEEFPTDIPSFIRPDWDENITDTPGGCATETNAYRRILLTWLSKVGPYRYHALNAHRVRIMDSFTHYHPKDGGFDEFYLVQMAMPDAKLVTSSQVDLITQPDQVKKEQVKDLLQVTPIKVGDLIYMPRGIIHRGLDGVLAQVITVPGFIPGSEVGVDHQIKSINDRLGLAENEALPFNESASIKAVIK